MADAAAGRGFKAALAAWQLATRETAKAHAPNGSTAGPARLQATEFAAAKNTATPSLTATTTGRRPVQRTLRSEAASPERGTAAAATLMAAPAAARGVSGIRMKGGVKARWQESGNVDGAAAKREEEAAVPAAKTEKRGVLARRQKAKAGGLDAAESGEEAAAAPAAKTAKEGVSARWPKAKAGGRAAARNRSEGQSAGVSAPVAGASSRRDAAGDGTAASDGDTTDSAVTDKRKDMLPTFAEGDQSRLPAAGGEAAVAVAAAAEKKRKERLFLKCSKCGNDVQDVLLLSCHHYLCLLCAARATEGLQHVRPASSTRGKRASSSGRRSNADILQCPVCEEPTVLSPAACTALRQQLRFFENPPGCCFDAGPVGCSATAAQTRSSSSSSQKPFYVALCSQCEQQPATVYCRSCVRRYCSGCAVQTHDRRPQMLQHRFQLLHQQELQQQREAERKKLRKGAVLEPPPARVTLQQSAQHMRTIDDCSSFLSSSRASSITAAAEAAEGRARKQTPRNQSAEGSSSSGSEKSEEQEVDSVHSSAIGFSPGRGLTHDDVWGQGSPGGAALLHRLRHLLAAVPLPEEDALSGEAAGFSRFISADLLRLRSVTNVACYVHPSQPVEFFCCSCESHCICAYCLTGFFPSGSAAAQTAAAAPQLQSDDHSGHFLQAVDAAWADTVLPQIEDEWGGGGRGRRSAGGEGAAVSSSGAADDAARALMDVSGRGILGQVRGEVELLRQQFLVEKSKEWRRSLQHDVSVVETTSELLLQQLDHKEQQLRGAFEGFTVRFCSETEEARRRLLQQAEQLQETLRSLRMHKAALDPTVLLSYYRDERSRLEDLCAADTPHEYRELPLSRRSVLQHAGQVAEELCGLAAELGGHVREADGTLFERLQQQQQQLQRQQDLSPAAASEQQTDTFSSVIITTKKETKRSPPKARRRATHSTLASPKQEAKDKEQTEEEVEEGEEEDEAEEKS